MSNIMMKKLSLWTLVAAAVLIVVLVAAGVTIIVVDKKPTAPADVFVRVGDTYSYKGEPNKKNNAAVSVPATYNDLPVTEIGANAFKDFKKLTSVTLPDSITIIQDNAFNGCTALVSISIPDSVTEICASAFANCTALKNITLSQNMGKVDSKTFENCTSLEAIDFPANITRVDSKAFSGSGIKTVTVRVDEVLTVVNDSFPFEQLTSVYVLNNNLVGQYWLTDIWKDYANMTKNIVKQPLPTDAQ